MPATTIGDQSFQKELVDRRLRISDLEFVGTLAFIDDYAALRACAHPTVQDAMDLALCTGQRPADVLKFNVTDIA